MSAWPVGMMSADVSRPLPADGVLSLGGRDVHVIAQTVPGPLVIMLGGCGVPSYSWDDVVDLLPDCSVLRLDRPGLVRTPWPGVLPELSAEVQTLLELTERMEAPAVLVAHSMAGLHAEALVRRRPDLVAALLLVDSSVDWRARRPRSGRGWLRVARLTRGALAFPPLRRLASLGHRVLVAAQSRRRLADAGSPIATKIFRSRDALPSVIAEHAAYAQQVWDLARLRESIPWPGLPTVVLTAASGGLRRWVADQRRLAQLLGARQVVIDDSRHLVMLDRPDVVVDAIRSLLGREADRG